MKLLLIIIEGQLYLAGVVAIFVAELGLLSWGLWSRRPIVGLVAVFVLVPLIRSTVSAIRACWFFRIPAPEGFALGRAEGRPLHEVVESIRRAVNAPPVDNITITAGFDAKAAVSSPSWWGRRRRTLVLGLPVLTTLSRAELTAVIAHELAHFSGAHDAFAAWVYRTRLSWLALRTALDRRLATPVYVYWLIRWYVPRLHAASLEVTRRHELVADRVAATVAGSRATADALVVFESGERFENEVYWPTIQTSHETAAAPPRPYSEMLRWNARSTSPEALQELFAHETQPGDSHPSLRERFAHLEESVRTPPPTVHSAGEDILGEELEQLAARLDREWMSRHGESWNRHRAEYVDRQERLDHLKAIVSPTADDLFERAALVETLHGSGEALPFYQSAARQGHPAASLAAGRVLLERDDSVGVALVEDAMNRDESLVPQGCRLLADHYRDSNQELAARKCEWRATRYTTRARLAEQSTSDA
jgi:Zn-dependent protease with chaperone function